MPFVKQPEVYSATSPEAIKMLVGDPCLQRAARTEQRIATVEKIPQDRLDVDLDLFTKCLGFALNQSSAKNPSNATFSDPVFVCLDTEGGVRELGLCILDTRDLKNLDSKSDLSTVLSLYN
jgi:hypothetical protein